MELKGRISAQATIRKATSATGFAAADFSRVRSANLGRFALDRLSRLRRELLQ